MPVGLTMQTTQHSITSPSPISEFSALQRPLAKPVTPDSTGYPNVRSSTPFLPQRNDLASEPSLLGDPVDNMLSMDSTAQQFWRETRPIITSDASPFLNEFQAAFTSAPSSNGITSTPALNAVESGSASSTKPQSSPPIILQDSEGSSPHSQLWQSQSEFNSERVHFSERTFHESISRLMQFVKEVQNTMQSSYSRQLLNNLQKLLKHTEKSESETLEVTFKCRGIAKVLDNFKDFTSALSFLKDSDKLQW